MNPNPANEETILEQALAFASVDARIAYLQGVCGHDAQLRARIESLIEAHEAAGGFLGAKPRLATPAAPTVTECPGSVIGRYKLLQKIGEGGMGIVYMAEQEEPVRRRVALKIIKLGMDTRQVVVRFEAERQALALMDHPNIARVLDGGETVTGRPYFVMELVSGVPLTEFCDKNHLSAEERIKLFIPVCQAIQSAHQKGIIHRDIKPSNVLVTLHNGEPVPKVIDFGVAKATNQKLTEKTLFTNFATMIGTPAYMSPEQAAMSNMDVDTRSDIYSLGVLLYELLTGTTPFPEKRLRSVGYGEMQRIIMQEEPERPSTQLAKQRLARTDGTAKSQIGNPKSKINSDLDWIVMKCLEKDRNRRYETASGLAADISRSLNSEPVVARPPSTAYRIQKVVRRNKLAFTAVAAVVLTLFAGIAVSSLQAVRAKRERALAERRLRSSLEFIDKVFESVSPDVNTLIGGGRVNRTLAASGLKLMEEFRKDADSLSQDFRLALAQLQTQLGFTQSWPVGNTTGDYEAGLKSATEAISLLQPSGTEALGDVRMSRLARAEMVAGYASLALLRNEEALGHFRQMEQLAARLALSTNRNSAAEGREFKQWAPLCIGDVLIQMGPTNVQRAIDEQFLPQLEELREAMSSSQSASNSLLWELRCVADDLGVAYSKLNNPREALPQFREAHRLVIAKAAQKPNNADIARVLVDAGAKLGETLLTLQQPEEGLRLLDASLEQAETLVNRDPANAGFEQLRITVLQHYALGMAAWSGDATSTPMERQQRLEKAQADLDRADLLLAELPTESARNWLRTDLEQARTKVAAARARAGAPGTHSKPGPKTEP